MRPSRRLCFAILMVLAACGSRVENGVGPGRDENVGTDELVVDNDVSEPAPEAAPPPPVEQNVVAPPAPRCGESRSHVVTYPCAGACIPMAGRPGCLPTMRICTRTESDPLIPCPAPPPPPAAAAAAAADPAPAPR